VLHRDIKPGNVIVGKHGETLVVDWGLAKAIGHADPGSGERTLMPSSASGSGETLPGSALGTPAYMSPEQAAGDLEHLGLRSDVYSLGATLYYLLTGKPPFAGDAADVIPGVQRGDFRPPRVIDPSIDPALEAICLKAMAVRPEDRYPSCLAMKDDIERWAAEEPVSVYRAPVQVRLARWARKHRTGVAVGAGLLQTAVVVLAVSTVLLGQSRARIERERQVAVAARVRAQAINNFLVNDLLGQADPERNPVGTDVSVRQLLDRAAKSLADPESSVAREPGVEGAVRSTIGRAYLGLALFPQAHEQFTRATGCLARAGASPEDIFFARNRANWSAAMGGDRELPDYTNLLRDCKAQLGREHVETIYAAESLALAWKEIPQALPLLRENLEIQRRRYGVDHKFTLRAVTALVIRLGWFGIDAELAEAESLGRDGAERWARTGGMDLPQTLYAYQELGSVLAKRGKLEEARSMLAPIMAAMVRVLGPDHFQTARTSRIYGEVLEGTGNLNGAEAQYR
jgi:hypothetical protein